MGVTEIQVKSPKQDIFYAIAHSKVRHINTLLNQLDVLRTRTTDGKTPLTYAVCESKEEVRTHLVRTFLRHGSDVNAQDENGRTALMYACMDHEKLDLVRVIARHKRCDPNIQDIMGYTAIMHAVLCANASAIRVLINSSSTKGTVDTDKRNSDGLTALELAVKLQLPECCKVLIAEGGANAKTCNNQTGLLRLLEDENFMVRSNTPHSRSAFASNFRKFAESPIPENKQFEGPYMSRDTTPVYGDRYDSFTLRTCSLPTSPQHMSRSNSLYRTNSNLFRKPDGSRPGSLKLQNITPQGSALGFIQAQRSLKRALTPISRTSPRLPPSPASTPDDQSLERTKLPSIPSGRKLYLVAQKNYDFSPLQQ